MHIFGPLTAWLLAPEISCQLRKIATGITHPTNTPLRSAHPRPIDAPHPMDPSPNQVISFVPPLDPTSTQLLH